MSGNSSAITPVEGFNKRLASFKRSVKANMEQALRLSQFSILHFEKSGDLGPCQKFYDAMPDNYLRKAAYKKWLYDHAPVMEKDGHFVKDKTDDATKFDTEGALKLPFWQYAPSNEEVTLFGADDVVSAVYAALKRFENEKKYKPTESGSAEIHAIRDFLDTQVIEGAGVGEAVH